MFLISLPDYLYQKFEFIESIKMTKDEVKQETKEMEGDPLIRQRRRQRAFELMRRNTFREVQKADVVITNPTHYAIALRYDPALEEAPRVMAKGEDHLALVIRNLARKNDIPMIENKPLARELYATVAVGDIVSEQFYRVLIDIFVNLESMKQKLGSRTG
jgi:flagellar biosynthetic protein FlhB